MYKCPECSTSWSYKLALWHKPIVCPSCGTRFNYSKPRWYLIAGPAVLSSWLLFFKTTGAPLLFIAAGVWLFYGLFTKLKFISANN